MGKASRLKRKEHGSQNPTSPTRSWLPKVVLVGVLGVSALGTAWHLKKKPLAEGPIQSKPLYTVYHIAKEHDLIEGLKRRAYELKVPQTYIEVLNQKDLQIEVKPLLGSGQYLYKEHKVTIAVPSFTTPVTLDGFIDILFAPFIHELDHASRRTYFKKFRVRTLEEEIVAKWAEVKASLALIASGPGVFNYGGHLTNVAVFLYCDPETRNTFVRLTFTDPPPSIGVVKELDNIECDSLENAKVLEECIAFEKVLSNKGEIKRIRRYYSDLLEKIEDERSRIALRYERNKKFRPALIDHLFRFYDSRIKVVEELSQRAAIRLAVEVYYSDRLATSLNHQRPMNSRPHYSRLIARLRAIDESNKDYKKALEIAESLEKLTKH